MTPEDLCSLRQRLLESGIAEAATASVAELEILGEIMAEYADDGHSPSEQLLLAEDFVRPPPDIQEFLESPYYLGTTCNKTADVPGLFPKWREEIYDLYDPRNHYRQLILTGSIGIGKSMVGSICLLYKLARALCMREPLRYYGLASSTTINFSFFSVTQAQVAGGTFSDAASMLSESPFFSEHIRTPSPSRKYSNRRIDFTKNLRIEAGSRVHEALGRNTLVALVDEINFRLEKDAALAAAELFNALEKRYKSRFRHVSDGLIILLSSAAASNSFLEQHMRNVRHDPTIKVCNFPWWDVVGPVRMSYSGVKFHVDIGDNITPASVVPNEQVASIPAHRLLEVPVEHRGDFDDVGSGLDRAIQDIAGVSTGRVAKLFPNLMPLINCIRDGLENPFVDQTVKLSLNSRHELTDCLRDGGKYLVAMRGSRAVPLRNRNMPRHLHIDVSSGALDALGMAMVHPAAQVQVERTDLRTQMRESLTQPVFELDFALRVIRETADDPIDFGKLRTFIWWLKKCGFDIRRVTCDLALLSQEMRNILTKMGFKTAYLSMDRTKAGYESLRYAVLEGRLRMFQHDQFIIEAANLEDLEKKIDHPPKFTAAWEPAREFGLWAGGPGSKDITDAIGGAVHNALTDLDSLEGVPLGDLEDDMLRLATAADENLYNTIGRSKPGVEVMVIE